MRWSRRARTRRAAARELDARRGRCLGGRARLVEPEVVELADGGVARRAHLAVAGLVGLAHLSGDCPSASASIRSRQAQKSPPAGRPAQRPLERVAVRVDEARQRECLGHRVSVDSPHRRAHRTASARPAARPAPRLGDPMLQILMTGACSLARLRLHGGDARLSPHGSVVARRRRRRRLRRRRLASCPARRVLRATIVASQITGGQHLGAGDERIRNASTSPLLEPYFVTSGRRRRGVLTTCRTRPSRVVGWSAWGGDIGWPRLGTGPIAIGACVRIT